MLGDSETSGNPRQIFIQSIYVRGIVLVIEDVTEYKTWRDLVGKYDAENVSFRQSN